MALALSAGCQTTEQVPEAPPSPAPPVVVVPPPGRPTVRPSAAPSPTTPMSPQVSSSPSPASSPSNPGGVSTTNPTPLSTDPRLTDGIAAYDLGDYNGAIRKLNVKELLESASLDIQTETRKFLAFSYCVTRRATLCKQQFDAALKSKPSFDLKPAEAGHPSWGPVFKKAKADALKK
jgi:hypothetical protein